MDEFVTTIFTDRDKLKVNFWRGGSGTDIVLLQGGMADASMHWSPVWEDLSVNHRVLAPDLPGFGKSTPLPDANWRTLSNWLKAFLESVGVRCTAVVGNSFGGTLARAFAAYYPSSVSHLAFLDGGGYIRIGFLQRTFLASPLGSWHLSKQKRLGITEESLGQMMPNYRRLDAQQRLKWQQGGGVIYSIVRGCILGPTPTDASDLPTLIVWGKKDLHSPVERAQILKEELVSSELVVLEHAGHLPQIDQPKEVVGLINTLIASRSKPA